MPSGPDPPRTRVPRPWGRRPAQGPGGCRFRRLCGALLAALVACAGGSRPARAIDLWDGRVEIHGFYETQIRGIQENLDPRNDLDLTQWAHVLNVEIEADVAPDGWGPFDQVSSFARLELRFDCVWTRGCGLFRSANAYGDRADKLPERVQQGRRSGFSGTQFTGNTSPFLQTGIGALPDGPVSGRRATRSWNTAVFSPLAAAGLGPDGVRGTFRNPGDDTTWRLFAPFFGDDEKRCLWGSRKLPAGNPAGFAPLDLPWNPRCKIQPRGLLRSYPNPWNPNDPNLPVLGAAAAAGGFAPVGTGALPYRPAPRVPAAAANADKSLAQGVYYPSAKLARRIRKRDFSSFDQNFSQQRLQWNFGASQGDEYLLREAYFDLELFDSRLWLRLGKQTIVWGKTELFRNQDRFNPQDLALSSLPSLEESLISLWAARGVWSFYDVGPLQDVRAEVAVDLDDFEPADIGRCGEPYAALLVCAKTFGLLVHGVNGLGLAGEIRPEAPWKSSRGIEVGGRLEWRYERFSFALTDFWGFQDLPETDTDFAYERNVDPVSGRPRETQLRGACRTGSEPDCLLASEALTRHHANQQLFAWICAATVGLVANQLGAVDCPLTGLFGSQARPGGLLPLSQVFGAVLGGQSGAQLLWEQVSGCGASNLTNAAAGLACGAAVAGHLVVPRANASGGGTPLVPLSGDPGDPGFPASGSPFPFSLANFLSPQQQALFGCGPFYQTNCDRQGIDLLNAEGSALLQAFPTFPGTDGNRFWSTLDATLAQPGTLGFVGGTVCTRVEGGRTWTLPGCRSPFVDDTPDNPADAYDILVDGAVPPDAVGPRVHPFTGQQFRSEMAVASWNLLMLLTVLGGTDPTTNGGPVATNLFDVSDPFGLDRCSFARPQLCLTVQSLVGQTAIQRPSVRAAGNGRFGRTDFIWHSGTELVLRYAKTNTLGLSLDFAEDSTKSNWGIEFTWEKGVPTVSNFATDGIDDVDLLNLTISVDRPTFINFLNQGRTFFFNSQLFTQYISGYRRGMTRNGPFDFLWTLAVTTGYFQDRLLPSVVLVWSFGSDSGAFLPQVSYRFTPDFSVSFGVALFSGRTQMKNGGISKSVSSIQSGRHARRVFVDNGLSVIRERDELFLRIRYTF